MNIFDAPNFRLSASSPAARGFLRRGLTDFHRALRYVDGLRSTFGPWRADDYRRVLPSGGGSDAARHALLAALAREHNAPVSLVLGIYEIDEFNTPGAGPVLRSAGVDSALDADCFLSYEGRTLDLARERAPAQSIRFIHTETILPDHVGEYRLAVYHRHLWEWAQARGLGIGRAWEIRQQCMEARASRGTEAPSS
jgi:hypothetical protein